jgi:hypothetical protein
VPWLIRENTDCLYEALHDAAQRVSVNRLTCKCAAGEDADEGEEGRASQKRLAAVSLSEPSHFTTDMALLMMSGENVTSNKLIIIWISD